jgi:hypothetical protein
VCLTDEWNSINEFQPIVLSLIVTDGFSETVNDHCCLLYANRIEGDCTSTSVIGRSRANHVSQYLHVRLHRTKSV